MSNSENQVESKENAQIANNAFKFYFLKNKRTVALGLVALIFTNLFDALPPMIIGLAIDQIASGADHSKLYESVFKLLVIIALIAIARYSWRIFWGRFHFTVANDLRKRIFNKLTHLGPQFYQKSTIGELMSLVSNDVNSFRMAIGPGTLILLDGIILICIFPPLMYSISPSLTWKTLMFMPILPFLSKTILKAIHVRYGKQQKKFAEMSGFTQELIAGIRVVKSHAKEKIFLRGFNRYSKDFENACNSVAQADAFFSPMFEVGIALGAIMLLIFGAQEVFAGTLTVGAFFTFYQYVQKMAWPASAIGMSLSMFQRGKASLGRILHLLEEPLDIEDNGTIEIETFESLEVKNLTFTYPGENVPALKDISFEIHKGESLGLIGATGSGKSTLLELLCRLFPVPPKSILINGHPIENITIRSLRNTVSLITQEPFLFSASISENISFSESESSENVAHYADLVQMKNEIENLPEKYQSMLGERGVNLSGGQKQRLSIARALYQKRPLILIDDSLSAVDTATEEHLLNTLEAINGSGNGSKIISGHRLSSLKLVDKVLVLKDGAKEAFGPLSQMEELSETYRTFKEIQGNSEAQS